MSDNIKLFVFDLDGTLIDTSERFYKVFSYLAEKYNLPKISKEEFIELYRKNKLSNFILSVKQKFLPEFLRLYQSFKSMNERPFKGVRAALEKLKANGYILAVVTGRITDSKFVENELDKHGLLRFIDDVLTNSAGGNNTDAYNSFLFKIDNLKKLMLKYRVKPENCVVVGDYTADIISGKKIGCKTIAVLTGGTDYEILKKLEPDFILKGVSDIPLLLKI
ncbi:MAG: HAD family hydrolase [Candidatus Odinarchaeia archaeon]